MRRQWQQRPQRPKLGEGAGEGRVPSTGIVMDLPLTPERKRSAAWPTETPAILEMWWSSKGFIRTQAL